MSTSVALNKVYIEADNTFNLNKLTTCTSALDGFGAVARSFQTLGAEATSFSRSKEATQISSFFNENQRVFELTAFLGIFSLLKSIPKLCKSVKKVIKKQSVNKIWPAINVLANSLSISKTIQDIISTAIKVAGVVSRTFAGIGIFVSVVDIINNGKDWWKGRLFLDNFLKNSGYNTQGRYGIDNYKQLCEFINNVGTKKFAKKLGLNTEMLNTVLVLKKGEIQGQSKEDQARKVEEIMNLIKNRLESNQKRYVAVIISDAWSIVQNALVIASLSQPYLMAVGIIILVGIQAANYISKTVEEYKIAHAMGMIHSNGDISVKNFFRWYFSIDEMIKPLNTQNLELYSQINEPLLSN